MSGEGKKLVCLCVCCREGGGHMTERSELSAAEKTQAESSKLAGFHNSRAGTFQDNSTDLGTVAMVTETGATLSQTGGIKTSSALSEEMLSPADECGDYDAPGGAAAVGTGLLRV